MKMTANDGTVFGVFNQGNGDYIAAEDAFGTHHAPPQYASLPSWSKAIARKRLAEAVQGYNDQKDYD